MQPVAFQDVRPSQSIYDEAQNSQNLQNMWQIAIASNSEWVQLVTWNDYSEGTSFAPSVGHGRALLDMSSYGLYSFRTGKIPRIRVSRTSMNLPYAAKTHASLSGKHS